MLDREGESLCVFLGAVYKREGCFGMTMLLLLYFLSKSKGSLTQLTWHATLLGIDDITGGECKKTLKLALKNW